jgi:uncharacterized spore protein YtfJ
MGELRIGSPVAAGGVTLVPIERSSVQFEKGDRGCWLSGLIEPVAIIVCDAAGIRAYNTTGTDIPYASLLRKIPNLGAFIEGI